MKYRLLLLAFCCCNVAFSQDRSWHLGIGFSTDYCSRTMKARQSDEWVRTLAQSGNENKVLLLGYTTGLYAKRNISKVFSLETGLTYTNKGHGEHPTLVFGSQVNPIGIVSTVTEVERYKYIGVPLKIQASFVRVRKLELHVTGGAFFNLFLEQKNTMYISGDHEEKFVTYGSSRKNKNTDISPFAGIGINILFSENIHLQLEPTYRYGVITTHEDDVLKNNLWTFGLNTVLYCRL
jgi:hypothetical protein